MEKTEIKNNEISKLFTWLGIIVLIISLLDLFILVFPIRLDDLSWIFDTSKGIVGSVLVPVIAMVLLLVGSYLKRGYVTDKNMLNITTQKEAILKQLEYLKKSLKINIPQNIYNSKINELNLAEENQIKMTQKALLSNNLRAIIELTLYSFLYLIIGKIAYSSLKLNLLRAKFQK